MSDRPWPAESAGRADELQTLFHIAGVGMISVCVRFALDASNHLPVAVAAAGLAIDSGLRFLAAASLHPGGGRP